MGALKKDGMTRKRVRTLIQWARLRDDSYKVKDSDKMGPDVRGF